jgi:hypothetical protein
MQKEPPASSRLCQHAWRPRAQTLPERGVVAAEDAGGDLELEDLVGALGDTAVPAWTLPSQSVYDVVIRGG